MQCLRCGQDLIPEARFCPRCGSARGADSASPSNIVVVVPPPRKPTLPNAPLAPNAGPPAYRPPQTGRRWPWVLLFIALIVGVGIWRSNTRSTSRNVATPQVPTPYRPPAINIPSIPPISFPRGKSDYDWAIANQQRSPAAAFVTMKSAAEVGYPPAMTHLGWMYDTGLGTPKFPFEAQRWYQKAADAGDARGLFNLGTMYESGRGVRVDLQRAMSLYEAAAKKNDVLAMKALAAAHLDGRGRPHDLPAAITYLERAAATGDIEAMRKIGKVALEYPTAYRRDAAMGWLRRAISEGDIESKEILRQVERRAP